jgi:hypothetical protein
MRMEETRTNVIIDDEDLGIYRFDGFDKRSYICGIMDALDTIGIFAYSVDGIGMTVCEDCGVPMPYSDDTHFCDKCS